MIAARGNARAAVPWLGPWSATPSLVALLLVAILVSLCTGPVALGVDEVLRALVARDGPGEAVLWQIRLPRTLAAALVGATLAVVGAALQGLARNPLADPGLIGVSSGAATGAAVAIVLGAGVAGQTVPLAAATGGLVALVAVFLLAGDRGTTSLILAGVAVNALAGAATGLVVFVADDAQLRTFTFFTLGGLGGAGWPALSAGAPALLVACAGLLILSRPLDRLLLGDAEARHLGVHVRGVRRLVVALSALGVGAAVAVGGLIGFVGLVVPHLVRLVVGPLHRGLLPASALAGASLVVLADLIARTVVAPTELPLGVVTALGGAPLLAWLLGRSRA